MQAVIVNDEIIFPFSQHDWLWPDLRFCRHREVVAGILLEHLVGGACLFMGVRNHSGHPNPVDRQKGKGDLRDIPAFPSTSLP